MNTPPKYPSTPHWPDSQTVHRDDSYHDNPAGFVGREVVITEKVDGGNTCLYNGEVFARSVAAPSTAKWFAMVKKHHAWKFSCQPDVAIYGEDIYGVHSIEYAPVREEDTYRIFAIRALNATPDRFYSWDEIVAFGEQWSIQTVPVLFRGVFDSFHDITDFFRNELDKESSIGGSDREGFVMRIAESFPAEEFSRWVCKYVRPNHVQTDEHWTKNWKPCEIDREEKAGAKDSRRPRLIRPT